MLVRIGEVWVDDERLTLAARPASPPGALRRDARAPGGDAAIDEALLTALTSADFDVVADLAVGAVRGPARRGVGAMGSDLAVPVAPAESAVLLVETIEGALHWQRPVARAAPRGGTRAGGLAEARPDLVHFSFAGDGGALERTPLRRGPVLDWAIDTLVEPVRAVVLRFVVSRTIDAAVARIEGGNPTGPVAITGTSPAAWTPGALPVPESWPRRRLLLMVHGTFSSTAGGFGGLSATDEGRSFLEDAYARYDLVLGHDHRTLAEDPVANAEAILATLTRLRLPAGTVIDAVAHSRGGLVLRVLVEQLLPKSGLEVSIGQAVFVACTNGGTHLAEPLNWSALVDTYTNIIVAAARGVAALAGAPPLGPLADVAIRTVGRFVQMFSEVAISDRRVPGLAAMEPGSPLVTALNGITAALGTAAYHAVTSSFEPGGGSGSLPAKVAAFLADRLTDQLFGQANDLVVDTTSMIAFGVQAGRLGDGLAFGDTAEVYHTNYFHSGRVVTELRRLLLPVERTRGTASEGGLVLGAPFSPDVSRSDRGLRDPFDGSEDDDVPRPRGAAPDVLAGDPPPVPSPMAEPSTPPEPAAAAKPAPTEPATVERFVAAEMMPYPEIERDARVYVTLSGTRIDVAASATTAATDVALALAADHAVDIVLIPRRNVQLPSGVEQVEVRSVDPKAAQTVTFTIRGIAAGPAELTIEVRQDTRILASFTLAPTFVKGTPAPLVAARALVAPPAAPPGSTILRIYETVQANNALSLRFELVCDDPRIALEERSELAPGFDLGAYVNSVLGDIEAAWNLSRTPGMYETALAQFVASAKTRTKEIVPAEIRRALWDNRDAIAAIQVVSDVPLIPWELLALVPPPGQPPATGAHQFLSDFGLVRWLPGVPQPGPTLGLVGARSRYVIPVYVQPGRNLLGAIEERAMLERSLPGIGPVEATGLKMTQFLGSEVGDADVIHFACHGLAEQKAVLNSYLLMTGFPGTTADDKLTIDQVKASACFAPKAARSLVFLNACQTGREGEGIAGVAGFADAFIRPLSGRGAAAFVGALWSVTDSLAQSFAATFYERLNAGDTLVDAVRAARAAARTGDDFTWLAYTVYGNPFASGVRE